MSKSLVETPLCLLCGVVAAVVYFICFDDFMVFDGPKSARAAKDPGREKPTLSGDHEHTLPFEGRDRRYVVHVPKGQDGRAKLPVVLAFHGANGHAEGMRNQSQLDRVADRNGFLVVYPDGTGSGRKLFWNAGSCCGSAVREQVNDVGFIRALLDRLPRDYSVDPGRIYATGMSNGGIFCHRLACELSDRIAAIAPVAGELGVDGPAPMRPVPIVEFHGMQDNYARFEGGAGPAGVFHRSIADSIRFWTKANHCKTTPVEVVNERDFIRTRYEPAPGTVGAPVILYALPQGGHTWPGGIDVTAILRNTRFSTGNMVKTVDASSLIWAFFEKHTLAGPVGARE